MSESQRSYTFRARLLTTTLPVTKFSLLSANILAENGDHKDQVTVAWRGVNGDWKMEEFPKRKRELEKAKKGLKAQLSHEDTIRETKGGITTSYLREALGCFLFGIRG